jgi:hypothetical protein
VFTIKVITKLPNSEQSYKGKVIEPIVTIEDSNVNNENMAPFAEVVNNQSSNKNNTDESDSKHGEQNKEFY